LLKLIDEKAKSPLPELFPAAGFFIGDC